MASSLSNKTSNCEIFNNDTKTRTSDSEIIAAIRSRGKRESTKADMMKGGLLEDARQGDACQTAKAEVTRPRRDAQNEPMGKRAAVFKVPGETLRLLSAREEYAGRECGGERPTPGQGRWPHRPPIMSLLRKLSMVHLAQAATGPFPLGPRERDER